MKTQVLCALLCVLFSSVSLAPLALAADSSSGKPAPPDCRKQSC